jgi:hypothetical protein
MHAPLSCVLEKWEEAFRKRIRSTSWFWCDCRVLISAIFHFLVSSRLSPVGHTYEESSIVYQHIIAHPPLTYYYVLVREIFTHLEKNGTLVPSIPLHVLQATSHIFCPATNSYVVLEPYSRTTPNWDRREGRRCSQRVLASRHGNSILLRKSFLPAERCLETYILYIYNFSNNIFFPVESQK